MTFYLGGLDTVIASLGWQMHYLARDPELQRRPRGMTFATGIHTCAGMHLARREARYVLEEFLSRFDNIRVAAGEKPTWQTDGSWSFEYLPLERP